MSIAKLDIESTVDILSKGIEAEFRRLLFARLAEVAQEITEQTARDVANSLINKVTVFEQVALNRTVVHVEFNQK